MTLSLYVRPQGCAAVCHYERPGGDSTNLVLFRLPSSDRVLAEPLFLDSQDFTPSTRSSTSESVSVSSPLHGNKFSYRK